MAIFDALQRFRRKWVKDKVPTIGSTAFDAMFHEAAGPAASATGRIGTPRGTTRV
jgi:hypothetical protein